MQTYSIELPWLIWTIFILFALSGVGMVGWKIYETIRLIVLVRESTPEYLKHLHDKLSAHKSEQDLEAQEILEQKVRMVWRSMTPVRWLDLNILRDECVALARQIARVYYPSSKRPEFEVTFLELLRLIERISHEITTLLTPFPILHKVSIATILETKTLYMQTKSIIDKRGIRTSGQIAGRTYQILNLFNPQYWVNRFVFKGATEMVGRKILTSIFRIVGTEAIRVYSTSSAVRVDPTVLLQVKDELKDQVVIENKARVIPEPEMIPLLREDPQTGQMEIEEISVDDYIPMDIRIGSELAEKEKIGDPIREEIESPTFKKKMYNTVAETLSKFLEGSLNLWDKVVNKERIISYYQKHGHAVQNLEDIQMMPLESLDGVVDVQIRKAGWITAAEGAATGMGGILLLSADAVSLLALQLRAIQQIGYCYGFDVSRPEEKLFAVKLLTEAYMHPAKRERETVIREMRDAVVLMKGNSNMNMLRNRLFVYGFRKIAEKIGIKLGSRKTAQILPVIGAVAGGYINRKVTRDIAEVAKEVYRDRLVQSKAEVV